MIQRNKACQTDLCPIPELVPLATLLEMSLLCAKSAKDIGMIIAGSSSQRSVIEPGQRFASNVNEWDLLIAGVPEKYNLQKTERPILEWTLSRRHLR